ncbi:hypothetical protein [Fibrobacter sp. UWB11]|uniref:hypothetical protein n=1 Tax=Fibrobacter sp. UWB11 TaxID=1896202 RepID=UPI00092B926D|nr:hypothetical protein [Fibrobacter sp. UWB11]SIO38070.1 hypothetical protein SAMN05720758_2528 [Fibrobacter sp. UWB11]
MKKFLLSIALAAVSAFAISAPKTHDGFFLNGTMGFGYSGFEEEVEKGLATLECKGFAYEGSFKIGGAVTQNVILHATIGLNVLFPDLEGKERGYSGSQKIAHDGFNIFMLGGGLTYFFPSESNIYVSASVGLTDISITFDGNDYDLTDLDNGIGFNITVGKEWWMNDELGLGVALSYTHNSADGNVKKYKVEASSNTFAIVASLTFN